MNPISFLFNEVIYRPLLNGLVAFYAIVPDLGFAIILLIIAIRLVLHRSIVRAAHMQRIMPKLQARLAAIQGNRKKNKEELARETMAVYREFDVHPFSFITPFLVQIPVFFGIYRVFSQGISLDDPGSVYGFLPHPGEFNTVAFGLFDLTMTSWFWAVAAGASQFLQGYLAPKPPDMPGTRRDDFGRALRWQMTYLFPIIFIFISLGFSAAIPFGWTVFSLVAILQQTWIDRRTSHGSPGTPQPDAREDGDPRRD